MPDKIDAMDDTVNQIVSLLQLMADIAAKLLKDIYTVTTAGQRQRSVYSEGRMVNTRT